MFRRVRSRGFTLIELLVVIAVIGVLAAVVMGSLRSARNKAKDAALRVSIKEFQKLIELDYSETGSYSNFQTSSSVWYPVTSCSTAFSGNYATQGRAICNDIAAKASDWFGVSQRFHVGNSVSTSTKYSIMIALNDGTFLCAGSSGASNTTPAITGYWTGVGCYGNP